jgi:hypothetical protein
MWDYKKERKKRVSIAHKYIACGRLYRQGQQLHIPVRWEKEIAK